jgi:hypothetical protein
MSIERVTSFGLSGVNALWPFRPTPDTQHPIPDFLLDLLLDLHILRGALTSLSRIDSTMQRCPSCNSSSTKTLPMIYGSGSSTSSSFWITSRGRVGSRGGSRQTRLAAAVAPPRAPSVVLGFIGMLIVSAIVWIVLANLVAPASKLIPNARQAALFQTFAPLFMLGVVVVIFLGWIVRHRSKKKRYLPRLAAWERTWMCQKCGTTWT